MAAEPIHYFNRHTGRVETEAVYGEAFLRWTYGTPAGRLALLLVARYHWFSRWYGWRMKRPASRSRVAPFVRQYGLDTTEFAEPLAAFDSFNDFFIRRLKPEARPVEEDPRTVVFPADGRHLGFAQVAAAQGAFVKGQRFDLAALLGDASLAARYAEGSLVLSRLCPVDYHRFHFPVGGLVTRTTRRPGWLYSVNPIALRRHLEYLWRNTRVISHLETEVFGTVLVVEIGATNVGSIVQTYDPDHPVMKGDEKGYFEFGGSSLITLFEPGRVRLAEDLLAQSGQGRELYARMGSRMAEQA